MMIGKWFKQLQHEKDLIEMDFKENRLEQEIRYNGDWQIVFTTPCTYKFSHLHVND